MLKPIKFEPVARGPRFRGAGIRSDRLKHQRPARRDPGGR